MPQQPKKSAFSRGMVSVTVTLRHHATQRLVRRHFDQIDHSLYVSTKVLREERRDEEAQQIEQVVVTTLEQFEQEVVGMTNKMVGSEKMLGSHFKVGSPSFDQEAEMSVNCSTGLATRILNIAWTVDCMLAETLSVKLLPNLKFGGLWRSSWVIQSSSRTKSSVESCQGS